MVFGDMLGLTDDEIKPVPVMCGKVYHFVCDILGVEFKYKLEKVYSNGYELTILSCSEYFLAGSRFARRIESAVEQHHKISILNLENA